jgi:hypothetical protein
MSSALIAALDALVEQIRTAGHKEREALKDRLRETALGAPDRTAAREHLEDRARGLPLEPRWEVEEVIELLTPPPAPQEPKPEEPKKKGLSQSDLVLVYDDPRGVALHRTKVAPERWFLTQFDPRTGQPVTQEIPPAQVAGIKAQLKGSPYWVLGSGAGAG